MEETLSAGVEGEGQGTGMQKWAKASLRDSIGRHGSPGPGAGTCGGRTKSSDLPTSLLSHPAMGCSHDLDSVLASHCMWTRWPISPRSLGSLARCREGSLTVAPLTRTLRVCASFSDACKVEAEQVTHVGLPSQEPLQGAMVLGG